MKYNLLKYSLMSLFMMLCGNVVAQESDFPKTATWDFTNADVVAAAVALSGTTEAGTIAAVENNGLLLTVEANGQTIRDNGNAIQTGNPVVFKVPVQGKKDVVTVVGFSSPYFAYSIGGTDATEATTVYTATAADVAQGYVEIVNKGQYLISIAVTQNEDNEPQPVELPITATWDFTNATVVDAVVALSGTTEAGTIAAVENNGLLLTVEANGQTIRDNGNAIQTGNPVVFKVPVQGKKDVVTVVGFSSPYFAYSIGGTDATEATTVYTATAADVAQGYVEIVNKGQYLISIAVTQNEDGDDPEPHDPVVLIWDYTDKSIPTKGPDNGLYYGAYVNDAPSTNMGFNGVKLNSSGYAFFEKPAVAGTLTLTFGNRKNSSAYAVNVYACTIADNQATKGDSIGAVAIDASPGSGSIDIPAEVTGIYIERKTSAEGVLSKIVFKETVARGFVDFEITNAELSGEFDASNLPTGVTFTGTQRNDSHGYGNVTITVPVDGTVKFTIGGCQYANPATCKVTNAAGELLAEPNLKTPTCYHQDGAAATFIYIGEPTTLTFTDIAYLPYFKAEATEVQEAEITFKDQNDHVLGTKTVFEGDPIGEIPYTEADLTIPEGEKFRGWVYAANEIKVKATDIVTGNVTIKASVTPIESVAVGTVQTYDLTKATFYPEDHETFSVTGGSYYNNHGFTFDAEGSFSVEVAGKAQIVLTLCQYGNGTTIKVTDAQDNVVKDDMPAKAENDGGITTVNYDGPATWLTFTFATQAYLHMVTVYNVTDFLTKDASGYYIVPAGDAAGLLMAINTANGEEGARIFLPNGTYDLGNTVKTTIAGKNLSIIGQSAENTIIVNRPTEEGLDKADLLKNTSEGLYMQDLTLKNDFDYAGNDGRAASLHDTGTKTICKNVILLSHQDTYYSHKVGGLYYWEGGELHGTVDYLCGNGKVYYNEVKLVNEQRSSSTITANSELYVFNNCTVENHADKFNFGRAWSDNPVCIYLNTTLLDPSKLIDTRWNLSGINCDYSIAGEYGTKDANGNNITPESNVVTFTKQNTTMNTILDETALQTYSIENVLGEWANDAQQDAKQLPAPVDAKYDNGTVTFGLTDNGMTGCALFKNGEFVAISIDGIFNDVECDPLTDSLTVRTANIRGGFGPEGNVEIVPTGISTMKTHVQSTEAIYNLMGVRVQTPGKGLYIKSGKKYFVK